MPKPTVIPFQQAVERLQGKVLVPSPLRSAEWEGVPLAIRERSLWSSGIEKIRVLDSMRTKLLQAVKPDGTGPFMDRSKFVADMRRELGAIADGTKGSLEDISSIRRLQLIYDFQVEDANSYGRWKMEQDPELLDEYPCQEFLRVESRIKERLDWVARWQAAGGQLYDGRMIARKDDPVWIKLSRFGRPWPPFDYGSGMGIEDIHRSEAEDMGVIAKGEKITPAEEGFNKELKASTAGLSPQARELLADFFGDRVNLSGDTASLEDVA
ncbi:MAG: hypothetical protein LBV12_06395 [Puniceicoccales bacterium]|jgi:hypothetical protein|nr:hypothetical protein [Puniceicoccales bacterium]